MRTLVAPAFRSLAPARSYFRCNLSPARSCHCTTQVPTSAELHHHVAVLMRNLGEADALAVYHQSLVLEPAFIISLTVPTHPTHPTHPPTFACPLEHMDASTHTPHEDIMTRRHSCIRSRAHSHACKHADTPAGGGTRGMTHITVHPHSVLCPLCPTVRRASGGAEGHVQPNAAIKQ